MRARPNSDQISYKTAITMDIVKKYKLSTLPAHAPQFWPDYVQNCSHHGYSKKYKLCTLGARTRPNSDQISHKSAVRMDIVKKYKLSTLPARAPQFWPDIIQKCSQDGYSKKVQTIYFTCARPNSDQISSKNAVRMDIVNQSHYLLYLRPRPNSDQISYKNTVRMDMVKQ